MSEVRRGPYAKGIARRQQILREALVAFSESDSSGPSLRSIAERVGLSERGLLHYFASREDLFVSVLAERDAADRELVGPDATLEDLAEVQTRSARTPGLVRLFVDMAAASPDTESPAHDFFTARYQRLRALLAALFVRGQKGTNERDAEEAAFASRMLIAASDGLQLQWLLDPTIDMRADLERLGRVLRSHVPDERESPRP